MASTYSSLKIQLMATGENNNTWGDITNTNLGTAIEEAITGSVDVPFSSATVTLTLVDSNATQSARNLRLNLTGTSGGAQNLVVPAIEKFYIVNNGCADTITVKNATGTGIAVPAGKTMLVFNNATNVVDAVTHLTSLTLASALPVASGGTGITSFGAGVATWLGTPSSANLAAAVTDETGSGALVFATSPTLVTPALGTPASGVMTNVTGLPLTTGVTGTLPVANGGTGITSFGAGVATFLGTPSSANLAAAVTDETGTGALVFATSPTLVTPALGTPASGVMTNVTGLPLTTGVTGTLPVANGGSGVTSLTSNGVLYGGATVGVTAAGTTGQVLVGNTGGAPTWGAATGVAVTSISFGSTGLTPSTATQGAITVAGTLAVANGGTGITSFGAGVATWLGTPSSANLAAAVTDETGSGALVFATSPTLVTPALGTPASGVMTNVTGLPLTTGVTGTLPVANGGTGVTSSTGTGSVVLNTSPTLVTPALGTPASGVMTNVTGLPLTTGVTGTLPVANGGTGVTSSTGTGSVVLSTSPTLVTPALGAASATSLALAAGLVATPSLTFTGDLNTGMWSPTADTIAWSTADSERMRITSAGLVGIGITSPLNTLDVRGNRARFNNVIVGEESAGVAAIQNSAASGLRILTNGYMALETSGSERLRITNFGNVGIGTTSPAYLLHLKNNATSTSLRANIMQRLEASGTGADVTLQLSDGVANTGEISMVGGDLVFSPTGAIGGVYIKKTSGNVGIGTTSPAAKLDVVGQTRVGGGSSADALVVRGRTSDDLGFILLTNNGGGTAYAYIGTPAVNQLAFYTNGFTERMRIDSSGNVGIGTTDQFGSGAKVIGLANATTNPSTNPTGGGVLYADAGALKWRGSSGTVTTIANA